MDILKMLVMFIHMGAGIIWIGALIYMRFILLPALLRADPAVRGAIMADVGPKTIRFVLRIAEITIAAGILNVFIMGKDVTLATFFTTLWGGAILLGFLATIAIYILGQAITRPTTLRIAQTVTAMAAGRAAADAPSLLATLSGRQRNILAVQVGIGIFVVLMMAVARFS